MQTLLSNFQNMVEKHPKAEALRIEKKVWTYEQLDQRSRMWAAVMLKNLRRPLKRVGVFAYRSQTAYVGTLAALQSGAAFVPLNRTFPVKRTRSMIRMAKLDAIIVDAESAPQLAEALAGLKNRPLILLPETDFYDFPVESEAGVLDKFDLEAITESAFTDAPRQNDIAYLLFTSGSTGVPKAVPIKHSNVLHYLRVMQDRYGISPLDRLSQTFDQTFDLSVFDMFMAWSHGACVCVLQPMDLLSPFKATEEMGITVWFSVPSVALLLLKNNSLRTNALPTLRLSLFCGEALSEKIAIAWQEAAPNSIVENLYGPTELTISCSVYRWDPENSPKECVNGVVPIGFIHPGLDALVFDDEGYVVRRGDIGELCVAGPQTFPGYFEQPELTQKAFWTIGGERFYRTGDLVRLDPNAGYIYMGRRDRQVKVSGYRIELAEVEGAIKKCPGVIDAVVVCSATRDALIGFVIGDDIDGDEILNSLATTLPVYMRPKKIRIVNSFPLNTNGKISHRALMESA